MAEFTPEQITRDGLAAPTYNVCTNGVDEFLNDGRTILHFKNAGVAPFDIVVTFDSQVRDNYGNDNDDTVVVQDDDGEQFVGPFNVMRYNLNGKVQMSYDIDPAGELTVAVLKLGDPG